MEKSIVVLVPCRSYDRETVYEKMQEGLLCAGGIESFIRKDEKVLLKLNLVRDAAPERAVTTHPVIVETLAGILHEKAYCHISAGDSPGFGSGIKIMEHLGLSEPFERYGVKMASFDSAVKTEFPEGIHAKEFMLAKDAADADAIISVCKMKTHALEHLTGAVKNQYGCVQGGNKAKGHTKYPSAESMARMIVDLDRLLKPRLYIMDGITAMEGNGPTSGEPVDMGVILISTDPVALDSVFAHLVYADPTLIPTETAGEQMGLGTWREENIEIRVPASAYVGDFRNAQYTDTECLSINIDISTGKNEGHVSAGEGVRNVSVEKNAENISGEKNAEHARTESAEDKKADRDECITGGDKAYRTITMDEAARRFGNPDFDMIRERGKSTGFMGFVTKLRFLARKPHIDPEKCVRCGVCVESCPVEGKALNFRNGRNKPPVYDYHRCIRCFCCQEMCPNKAIYVK